MRLECSRCGLYLGEMEKGKLRNGAVVLCEHCWRKADSAMNMAEMVAKSNEEMPGFFKGLFGDKAGGYFG